MTKFFGFELLDVLRRISARLTRILALLLPFSGADCGADTFRILYHFPKPSGPTGTLVVSGEMVYGVTEWGGPANAGTVFRLNTNGQGLTVLHEFAGTDGHEPRAGLVLSGDTLYGTTLQGGLFQAGTVFKMGTDGTRFQVLKHFNPSLGEGQQPTGSEPMVLSGNTLYGMTSGSGADTNGVALGHGTVFRLQTDGTGFLVMKNFPSGVESSPWSGLVLGDGTLYGTTSGFSGANLGTVFRLNTDGSAYQTLWQFAAGADASFPLSGVVLGGNTLFGTTYYGPGGQHYNSGTVFRINADGTGFANLHVFDSSGSWPREGLLLADGVIYGPTMWGPGSESYGSVYALTTNGATFHQLKQFAGTNGAGPSGLALSGRQLYGVCGSGGTGGGGVLYTIPIPTPFVTRHPLSQTAEVGNDVRFSVVAEGSPPLTYELFFNGTNRLMISSQSTLILPHVQPAQIGTYTIRVSNPFGSLASAPADLNVIVPVPRRLVPGLVLDGSPGTQVDLETTPDLESTPAWAPLETITLTNAGQWYFDLAATLGAPRFYRAKSSQILPVLLGLKLVPAITLTGIPGSKLRLDYLNQFGPVDDWVTLETVTLGSPNQLFFDTAAPDQPARLYRILSVP